MQAYTECGSNLMRKDADMLTIRKCEIYINTELMRNFISINNAQKQVSRIQ
jgi:hypothetical protein